MQENTAKLTPAPSVIATLVIGGGIAALLLAGGRRDYPDLHHVLDTGICLLSGIMAVLFWDLGRGWPTRCRGILR